MKPIFYIMKILETIFTGLSVALLLVTIMSEGNDGATLRFVFYFFGSVGLAFLFWLISDLIKDQAKRFRIAEERRREELDRTFYNVELK